MNTLKKYTTKYFYSILFTLLSINAFAFQQQGLEKQISLQSIMGRAGYPPDSVKVIEIKVNDLSNILMIGVSYSKDSTFINEQTIELSIEDLKRPEVQKFLTLESNKERESFQKQMTEPLTQKISPPINGVNKREFPIYSLNFYLFNLMLNTGEGRFELLSHLEYEQQYFFRVYATDSNGNRHFTKTRPYKMRENTWKKMEEDYEKMMNERSNFEYVYAAVALIFYGTGLYVLIFPIVFFIFLFYFKNFKFSKSLKHTLLYILFSLPIVTFLNFLKIASLFSRGSFPTELFTSILLILIGFLYIRILKRRNG